MRNFAEEILLMELSDWSVSQCLQTSNEASIASSIGVVDVGFQKFISSVKSALSKEKLGNFSLEINLEINFQCERGLRVSRKYEH